jgi:raffinose/stachyose/melibiose transport system substrate-binding protein
MMAKLTGRSVSRRNFLKWTGGGLAAVGLGPLLQACGAAPTEAPAAATSAPVAATSEAAVTVAATSEAAAASGGQTLKMWWWGEQEAPGLEKWLNETIASYQKQSGHTIEPALQDTSVVISEFQTASAANNAPDIQYFWNGIYHMESAWLGYIEPLNGLIPDDLLKASNATPLSTFEGKQYRLGWYGQSILYIYNKEMFDKAGLDGNTPPQTWDDLLAACDKLKSANFTPIVGGLKDGPWGEWYMGHGLTQNLDSPSEALDLFAANLDWREPKYWEHWAKVEELWKAGFINNDMNSIDLYPGIDLFGAGKGAMTAVAMALVPAQQKMLGAEKVGAMSFPVFGKGKMAGKPIIDTAGIGISSQSQNKEAAADFLQFLMAEEQLRSFYSQIGALPVNTNWDGQEIEDPLTKELWSKWIKGDGVVYISNLMPTLFWTDAMFVNSQKIVAGEFTGEQAGELAQEVAQKWREQNPDLLEKYTAWAKELKI